MAGLRQATAGQEEAVGDILELIRQAVALSVHTDTPKLRQRLIAARNSAEGAKRHAARRRQATDRTIAKIAGELRHEQA